MRWPSDAVSLVGRSLNLETGRTYKLMCQLRVHSVTFLKELWALAATRNKERNDAEERQLVRADWAETDQATAGHHWAR